MFAFLNIFWLHISAYRVTNYHQSAAWAVSFFFVLSGFLYGNKYAQATLSIKYVGNFILNKLKKFWPLHFFTTILMFGYSGMFVISIDNPDFKMFVRRLILNLMLIQSWSQDGYTYYSFTGVAWYLSDLLFLIVLTVPLIIVINKVLKTNKHIILGIFIDILLAYIYYFVVKSFNLDEAYWLYVFPPARIFEYIGGILVGKLVNNIITTLEQRNFNNKSVAMRICFTLVETGIFIPLVCSFKYIESIPTIWRSTAWIIPNILLILVFSLEKGYLSSVIFGNKIMIKLGGDTFDAYLIHQVVNIYFSNAMGAVAGMPFETCLRGQIYMLLVIFTFAEIRRLPHRNNIVINKTE